MRMFYVHVTKSALDFKNCKRPGVFFCLKKGWKTTENFKGAMKIWGLLVVASGKLAS